MVRSAEGRGLPGGHQWGLSHGHSHGDSWRYGATGPSAYDCSGLVFRAFKSTGLIQRIGGSRRTAAGYLKYFRDRGLATRAGGRKGDLVVYGGGSHLAIYLGNGRVISALTNGVSIHGLHAVRARFTAFLRVRLSR
ncbi:MAG: C40 family peptidase [Chloroflexi bacterium]|nr:C40 family peptidase [Chloroflexota bacterium]